MTIIDIIYEKVKVRKFKGMDNDKYFMQFLR